MANKRIKDITTASTSFASDDFVITDSATSGTRKMTKDNLISQVSAGVSGDYLEESNNLSDVASAATSRANLYVNSTAQDAESDGTKIQGPSMHFDGSNDYVEFADNDAFSFTSSTDDTPFTVSSWVKMKDATSGTILSKFGSSASTREYRLYADGSDLMTFDLRDASGNNTRVYATTAMTGYENQWIHVAATYAGSGPNSATAFTSAADAMSLYVNGKSVAITKTNNASYSGMSNTSEAVVIGRRNGADYLNGEIRDVKLFNKALSAAEVKTLCLSGSLPNSFSESTGTASLNNSTFANSTTSSRQFGAITGASATGFTAAYNNANTNNRIAAPLSSAAIKGKKYKATFTVNTDGADVILRFFNAATLENTGLEVATINTTTATAVSYEWTETGSGDRIGFLDNSPAASGNLVVSSFRIIQIGSVLDARAENYNQSAGKLLDATANNFVGTGSGVTIINPRTHVSAETLDLTNLPTSDSGLLAGEVYNASGTLKIKL